MIGSRPGRIQSHCSMYSHCRRVARLRFACVPSGSLSKIHSIQKIRDSLASYIILPSKARTLRSVPYAAHMLLSERANQHLINALFFGRRARKFRVHSGPLMPTRLWAEKTGGWAHVIVIWLSTLSSHCINRRPGQMVCFLERERGNTPL